MTCMKTGCALKTFAHVGHFWGDMHCLPGGLFVFNAVTVRDNHAVELMSDLPASLPTYYLHDTDKTGDTFFERRGVFVMSVTSLGWNEALRDYLGLSDLGRGPLV